MLKIVPDEPALILETSLHKILIISDLHLGFEKGLSSKGINIPSQTQKIFDKLKSIIEKFSPDSIIILGDVKHGTLKIVPQEWVDVPQFLNKIKDLVKSVEIIRGNHDGGLKALLPKGIEIHSSRGISIKDGKESFALIHGHAWPYPKLFNCDVLIMGHNHPIIEFREYGFRMVEPVWVMARWDKKKVAKSFLKFSGLKVGDDPIASFKDAFGFYVRDSKIVIMPNFNPLLGGNAINVDNVSLLGPLFSSRCIKLDESEIYLLDGSYLGHLSNLIS
ncbi:MAG: metallophosphoesterase [archaeon]|nr:metallophosphoesterase [archaeon]MCP8313239.1 metallophosphoesterase [archaeon]MCP8319794.1 metallophosphoesterase [archaeon]